MTTDDVSQMNHPHLVLVSRLTQHRDPFVGPSRQGVTTEAFCKYDMSQFVRQSSI